MSEEQLSIADAIKLLCEEKGISFESVIEIIEAALAAAYRKDFGEKNQNIKVEFDLTTGGSKIFDVKTVVDDVPEEELAMIEEENEHKSEIRKEKPVLKSDQPADEDGEEEKPKFNPKTDIQISEAKEIKKGVVVGDVIKTELPTPSGFGRMAAQTAKQVITQKVRESEREAMYEEYKDKQGEIIVGTVQRQEGRLVLIDLGKLTALLPPEEQIQNERYVPGTQLKLYVVSVAQTTKGPEIIVSRAHPDIVKRLFILEIPEIANGTVEIKGIAREAGSRSKIAVWTEDENIDPIGSCIGQRGARIQTIISELKGEKVDIVKYSDDPVEYIINALSPAKIINIDINEETKEATVKVNEDQLSLAIGKSGQNVRLAARLTGWKINIISASGEEVASEDGEESEENLEKEIQETDETDKAETGEKEEVETKEEAEKADDKKEKKEKKSTKKSKK
ncbi:MAG: transcription termination/antitermination protein NusA [Candidatus Buchananbacteria bacterium]|nr:transcription termination/antitermination protein NusA [Candidatus Buchananbacteria bacterium]